MGNWPRWTLGVVLGAALMLRLGWALHLPADPASLAALPDQQEYLTLAQNLLSGCGLQFVDPRFGQTVHAYRMPGYPVFLAALGGNLRVVRVTQALLDTLNVLAVWILGRRLLGPGRPVARLLAAALVAFNPYLVYFSGLVLSESLFTAMLAWAPVLLIPGQRRLRWFELLGAALLLIAGIYVRPSGLLLPLVLVPAAIWANRRFQHPYQTRRAGLALPATAALILLCLTPWAARNLRILGSWLWTTTNAGVTAYDGWNPSATGASDQSFIQRMPQLQSMNELQRSRYLSGQANAFIRAHPAQAARLALHKIARTWSIVPLSDQFGSWWLYRLIGATFTVPFFVLVLIGLGRKTLPGSIKTLLLLPAIYFTLVHAASVGSLRYRIPVEPPMALLAGAAWAVRRTGESS